MLVHVIAELTLTCAHSHDPIKASAGLGFVDCMNELLLTAQSSSSLHGLVTLEAAKWRSLQCSPAITLHGYVEHSTHVALRLPFVIQSPYFEPGELRYSTKVPDRLISCGGEL